MTTTTPSTPTSYRLSAWRLDELLPSAVHRDPEDVGRAIDRELEALAALVGDFEALRPRLEAELSRAALLRAVRAYEQLLERAYRLSGYASLAFSADTQSEAALTLRNRVQQALIEVENRVLFLRLLWQDLADETAERLLAELASRGSEDTGDPGDDPRGDRFADVLFYLRDLRRLRPYKLDERSEQIVNLKDADGIGGVLTLYSMLTNGFGFRPPGVAGEREAAATLTRDQLMTYAYSERSEERAGAYQELYRVYGEHAKLLAQMYSNRVRDWHNENVKLRGYASALGVRNVGNDIPDQAVHTLLEVVRGNAALFQRYFQRKASWLGLPRLRRYDIYAPLASSGQRVEYGEAVERVLDTFGRFHPELGRHAQRVFAKQHIDSEPRPGKKGGAFCATILPSLAPWVLVNYTGRLRDVATLAHELGHAVHSMLAEGHSLLTQHPSLPLAETASVFGEILMTDRLLEEHRDPVVRRELLATAVDDMYATVMRQAYFVLFEQEAHRAILAGGSPEELQQLYLANLSEQFGDSVELAPEFRLEWLSIPHIYSTPFYCYAYSFGQLLVLALYRRYQQEGEAFKPAYLRLLAHGGSRRPQQLLEEAGVDMTDPGFWQGGFGVIEDMIAQLEAL